MHPETLAPVSENTVPIKENLKETGSFSETRKAVQNEVPNDIFNQRAEAVLNDDHAREGLRNAIQEYEGRLPLTGGVWSGDPGNSEWYPDRKETPGNPLYNPEGRTWAEILDDNGVDGISFKNGEPDFSEVSEGTVDIDDFSSERNLNYTQADEKLAATWSGEGKDGNTWAPDDVKIYRQENKLTWHERTDMKTMDLVPRDLHGGVPHAGGISEIKKRGMVS